MVILCVCLCEQETDAAGSGYSPWEWAEMDPLAAGGKGDMKKVELFCCQSNYL